METTEQKAVRMRQMGISSPRVCKLLGIERKELNRIMREHDRAEWSKDRTDGAGFAAWYEVHRGRQAMKDLAAELAATTALSEHFLQGVAEYARGR